MKKHWIVLCFFLLSAIVMEAQKKMFAYDVAVTNKTYTAITDGTIIPVDYTGNEFSKVIIDGDGNNNFSEIDKTNGFQIGFNFRYNGLEMNQFMVGTDGTIFLGNEAMTLPGNYSPFNVFDTEGMKNVFGLVTKNNFYGLEDSEISYKVEGTEGNRVLVIQYSNIGVNSSVWDVEIMAKVNIQYRLYEATGNIEMHLNNFEPIKGVSTGYYSSIKIGIKGDENDMLMLENFKGKTTTKEFFIDYNEENFPENGFNLTFIAPEKCNTPTMQPTNVKLYARSTSIYGSLDIADADHYMILVNKENNFDMMPKDKTTYEEGDSIGNVVVAGIITNGVISTADVLEENTTYYGRIISYNAMCLEGPLYNLISPVEFVITTMGGAPTLKCKDITISNITLSLETGEETAIIAMSEKEFFDPSYQRYTGIGDFGLPTGVYEVGDTLEGGAKVVYIGKSNDNIVIDNLTDSKPYYFKAWNTDGKGGYSSLGSEQNLTTSYTIPWNTDNLKDYMQDIPAGWNYQGDWYTMHGEIISMGNSNKEKEEFIETPYIKLTENTCRLITEFVFGGKYGEGNYSFGENDFLKIQITNDGINYEDLFVYNSNNAKEVNTGKRRALLEKHNGQYVRIRYTIHTSSKYKIVINSIKIEEKPLCDYPLNVTVSNIIGNSATIGWTVQSKETNWEISLKKSNVEEWNKPILVNKNPHVIMGLDAMGVYNVRVRAVMDNVVSAWSEITTFQAGLSMPLDVNFDEIEMMDGWKGFTGVLANPSELQSSDYGFSFNESRAKRFSFSEFWSETGNYWFISPKIIVDKDIQTVYNIELGITMEEESSYSNYCTDQIFKVLISKDGESFNNDDAVLTLNQKEFPAFGASATYKFTVSGLQDITKLAFYTSYNDGNPINFYIDYLKFNYVDVPTSINGTETNSNVVFDNGKLIVYGCNRVEVYDINGKMVISANNADTIDCSSLANGIYIAKIINNSSTIIKKFFVK